jgi:uncharacterized membrane protein
MSDNKLTPDTPRRRPGIIARVRANFLTGVVVIAPIGLTIWLILTVVGWVDGFVLPLIPRAYHPDVLLLNYMGIQDAPVNIRGVGLGVFLIFTVIVGWVAKGLIGRSFLRWAEGLVDRMPVVRSIYNGVKQIAETVFAQSESSFEKACLIEYPRRGIWAVAFISTGAKGEIASKAKEPMLGVFVPTTPNPTSGFLLFFPKSDVVELDMSVEDAAKLIISAGLVYPNPKNPSLPPVTVPPALDGADS